MEETDILLECGHCKNKSELIVRKRYAQTLKNEYDDQFITVWRILECPACSRLNLSENYLTSFSEESKSESGAENFENGQRVIYPVPKNESELESLPQEIKEAYKAALKVKNVPDAFAVQIGRTLEVLCKHMGAEGHDLKARIDYLVKANRIPPILAEMAHELRKFRNVGAHADDSNNLYIDDVTIIEEFIDAILEFLYIAPAKVKSLQERREEERLRRKEIEEVLLNLSDHPF